MKRTTLTGLVALTLLGCENKDSETKEISIAGPAQEIEFSPTIPVNKVINISTKDYFLITGKNPADYTISGTVLIPSGGSAEKYAAGFIVPGYTPSQTRQIEAIVDVEPCNSKYAFSFNNGGETRQVVLNAAYATAISPKQKAEVEK